MYSSGYSQVSRTQRMAAQKKMQYHSKSKGCGYYMRIVFFFSSLIQSLIIVSLVLFLVYGKKQDSASTARIQDLEETFSRLSIENVALKQQRKNLTNLLNTTLVEKVRNDWDLGRCRYISNISRYIIEDLNKKQQQCTVELLMCKNTACLPDKCPQRPCSGCDCGTQLERLTARLQLVESNFTQTTQTMRTELDQITKDRDNIHLEAIRLRRDKSTHEKAMQFYKMKCKNDFARSLSGVTNVSTAFLQKIDTLFPSHIAFQLTCQNQRDHLEQIRTNCTSLSREVEDKFQRYLNNVGEQMASIQAENSVLKAENQRFIDDYRWCTQNRTGLIKEQKQNFEMFQVKLDKEKEKLLIDKMRLHGDIEVLQNNVKFKTKEIEHVTMQLKQLNMSCMLKTAVNSRTSQTSQSGAWNSQNNMGSSSASSSSSGLGQIGRTGSGIGSILNGYSKPVSTGQGSSSSGSTGSSPSLSLNKPATSGRSTPSIGTSSGSTGSIPNLSSIGSGLNKPGTPGLGSSSSGSTGSIASSGGTGPYKPTSSVKSSPSSGSTGSSSKSGPTFPWLQFGLGSSNTGQNKPGSGTGKGTSTGSSNSGTGSVSGRTAGLGGGSVNLAQHLQELQRIINPSSSDEKQDLSRMLG